MKQSLTKSNQSEVSARGVALQRVICVPAVIEDVRSAFFGLCVHAGKQVLAAMMEEDRTRLCGPTGRPDPDRRALRGGHTRSWVVMGGRRTPIQRARARAMAGEELSLPSMVWASGADPLNAATLSAIAAGVSGRRYAGTLDALAPGCEQRAVSRSSVSRRFVALSAARLTDWLTSPLGKLDLPIVMIDGIHFRGRVVLVALGIDAKGEKHVLALREGHSENATLVRALIADLVERGLDPETARLWVIDGSKALRRAIAEHFGDSALIQRCQIHKLRNVLGHLPDEMHASVRRAVNDAWHTENPALALKQLQRLAGSLAREHPGAASSLREGMEETLTLRRLGIDGALYRTLRTTNAIENLNGSVAHYTRNVRRWRDGRMLIRWIGAALLEARRGFRRLRGYRDIKKLRAALVSTTRSPKTELKVA